MAPMDSDQGVKSRIHCGDRWATQALLSFIVHTSVLSTSARKTKSPARSGPTHRLQQLLEALSRPGQVQTCYTMFVSERLSPSARERVPGGTRLLQQQRGGTQWSTA